MDRTMYGLLVVAATHALMLASSACPQDCFCSDTRVECSRRQLQVIPEGIPENVSNLDLRDNQITDVDAGKLTRLQSLQTLSLQMNRLSKLKSLTFVNLPRLSRLHMANNEIETIDENAFQGLPSLKDLDLTGNKLSDITGKFHIDRLQRLILSHNQITSLQDDTLKSVRSLHYLILSNNNISYISKSALNEMADLTYLDLKGNPINNIDYIFGVQLLSYLDISRCHLTHMPKGLPWPLRFLKISENNLTMIQAQDFQSTRYLAHLIADNNQIQIIQDGALSYTPYLTEVNINYNKIKWLPQIPSHIETFIADNNEIQQLYQSSFAHDSSMKILSLRNNNIHEIPPNTFSRLSNLNSLNLGHNAVKHLQNMSFAGLRQLIALNLEFNPLEKIDYRAFGGLQKLEKLNLSNANSNQTVIEGAIFQDVPSLASLYLQSSPSIINDIMNNSELLRSLRNIQHLYLTNGSVETISMDMKQFLPQLKSIQLSDNPWHCDSELVGLHNWMKESPELFADSSVTCASPDHLKGRAIQDVSIQELTMAPPIESSYFSSHSSEFILSITTTFDEMSQTETSTFDQLGDGTQLLQPTSTAAIIQVTESENVDITPLLQVSDITTNLEVATSAYYEKNFSKEQHQVLISSTTSDHYYTPDISTISPSLTSMATELNQELFPSTAVPELPPPMPEKDTTGQFSTSDVECSAMYTWSDNQIPAKSTPPEASSTSTNYPSAHAPSNVPHSNNTPTLSTTTITSQITSSTTSTFTMRPTNGIPTSSCLTDTTEDLNTDRQSYQISTAERPSLKSSSSNHATIMTLPMTHLSTSHPPTATTSVFITTSMLALNRIIPSHTTRSPELTAADSLALTLARTPQLRTWSASQTETLASISVSESVNKESHTGITFVTRNTAVADSTQVVADSTHTPLEEPNSTDSDKQNKGDPIKPAVKSDNRLPTFSSSADMKLRAIIITVSTTLLALITGLFITIIVVKYCKKRKHVSFDDKTINNTDTPTETSDTVFIISHMEGGHNLNIDTSQDGKTSTASPKDQSEAENCSKETKKGSKFSRQSVSAVISKTKFDCIKGQTEDDSELLMYSWT